MCTQLGVFFDDFSGIIYALHAMISSAMYSFLVIVYSWHHFQKSLAIPMIYIADPQEAEFDYLFNFSSSKSSAAVL